MDCVYLADYAGRFGNHLFQIGAVAVHAYKTGKQAVVPIRPSLPESKVLLNGVIESDRSTWPDGPVWNQPHWGFCAIPDLENIRLSGFFTSWRYFDGYHPLMRNLFSGYVLPRIDGRCAVHIRRGDFLYAQKVYPCPNTMWYRYAIADMRKLGASKFIAFSDDREWVRENLPELEIYEGKDYVEDFMKMTQCQFFIIPNSTFSWWAAWLADGKVICPENWFGPLGQLQGKDVNEMVWSHWTRQ